MAKSAFFKNTSILMISNIISGVLIFAFTLTLSREIEPRGMGLYQLVIPLYTVLLYVTGGGISVAMSQLGAFAKANGRLAEFYRTIYVMPRLIFPWSLLITGMTVLAARFLSTAVLSDSRTYLSILAFCPGLIFASITSIYRGAFYGVKRVVEPAVIDIVEKSFKILILYCILTTVKNISLDYVVGAAIASLSLGECIGFVLFYVSFQYYKRRNPGSGQYDNDYQLVFNVVKKAIPISIEGIASAIFSTLIAMLIPKRLVAAGFSYEVALSLLGKLQGMAINIALLPMIIINAFNMIIIPAITEDAAKHNDKLLNHRINSAISVASFTAFLTSAILLAAPNNIASYFYSDAIVGQILLAIIPALPILYLEIMSYSILNGLGQQARLLRNSVFVQTFDIILMVFFIGAKTLNIYGYGLNMFLSSIIGLYLNYKLINSVFDMQIDWMRRIIIPLLCGIMIYILASNIIFCVFGVPTAIFISVILYCFLFFSVNTYLGN